jgi:hypothetical protein
MGYATAKSQLSGGKAAAFGNALMSRRGDRST